MSNDESKTSISDLVTGLTSHSSILKQAELAKTVTGGFSPEALKATVAQPRLKIPRSIKSLNREYKDFDVDALILLKKKLQDVDVYEHKDSDVLSDVEDALQRYIDDYKKFKQLNDEQFRQISMKKAELELEHENHRLQLMTKDAEARLESKYDWKAKWRHLFVRGFGVVLFMGMLLFVGWLTKNYDWAELPYSTLMRTMLPVPKI